MFYSQFSVNNTNIHRPKKTKSIYVIKMSIFQSPLLLLFLAYESHICCFDWDMQKFHEILLRIKNILLAFCYESQ